MRKTRHKISEPDLRGVRVCVRESWVSRPVAKDPRPVTVSPPGAPLSRLGTGHVCSGPFWLSASSRDYLENDVSHTEVAPKCRGVMLMIDR